MISSQMSATNNVNNLNFPCLCYPICKMDLTAIAEGLLCCGDLMRKRKVFETIPRFTWGPRYILLSISQLLSHSSLPTVASKEVICREVRLLTNSNRVN